MKFSTLERKARAAVKSSPHGRLLERKKLATEKGLAAGKYSRRQAADLKSLLRLRRKRLLNREIYKSMRAKA